MLAARAAGAREGSRARAAAARAAATTGYRAVAMAGSVPTSPAFVRNREPILAALLAAGLPEGARVLEVASGPGEHAAYLAPRMPGARGAVWFPTEADPALLPAIEHHCENARAGGADIRKASQLDAANRCAARRTRMRSHARTRACTSTC